MPPKHPVPTIQALPEIRAGAIPIEVAWIVVAAYGIMIIMRQLHNLIIINFVGRGITMVLPGCPFSLLQGPQGGTPGTCTALAAKGPSQAIHQQKSLARCKSLLRILSEDSTLCAARSRNKLVLAHVSVILLIFFAHVSCVGLISVVDSA